MTEPVEVAIEKGLLDRLISYCASLNILLALPNVKFSQPTPGASVFWLRPTFLPADTFALGVDFRAQNQHYGLLQIDIFHGNGFGEYPVRRIAANLITLFIRGTTVQSNGITTQIWQTPYCSRLREDIDPVWAVISVSIPYIAFANPA